MKFRKKPVVIEAKQFIAGGILGEWVNEKKALKITNSRASMKVSQWQLGVATGYLKAIEKAEKFLVKKLKRCLELDGIFPEKCLSPIEISKNKGLRNILAQWEEVK